MATRKMTSKQQDLIITLARQCDDVDTDNTKRPAWDMAFRAWAADTGSYYAGNPRAHEASDLIDWLKDLT